MNAPAPTTKQTWARFAQAYASYGPPLLPTREDVAIMEEEVERWWSAHSRPRVNALILGVTPALARMRWPSASVVMGIDVSKEVIGAIWPGDVAGQRRAVCGDWSELPRKKGSCNVVIGDGSLIAARYSAGLRTVLRSIRQVLSDDGALILRCYVQPDRQESIAEVFAALFERKIIAIDSFKLRLFMAVQKSVREGTAVRELYRVVSSYQLSHDQMVNEFGWSPSAIATFQNWRDADTIYNFPTLSELNDVAAEFFEPPEYRIATSYECSDRCPTLVLRPKECAALET